MLPYFARRSAYMLLLLLLVSVVAFAIIELPPGDYLTTYIARSLLETAASDRNYSLDRVIRFDGRSPRSRGRRASRFRTPDHGESVALPKLRRPGQDSMN